MTIGHDPRHHGNPTGRGSRSGVEHARLGLVSEVVAGQQPRPPPAAHRLQEKATKTGPPERGSTVLVRRLPSLEGLEVLQNQASAIWTCDFCVQYTVKFTALYVFVIMELGTRRVVHFNVTEHPTQAWVKQQLRNATFEEQPKFLTHDNDGIFGQFGRPVTAEVNGKKVSCRSSFDLWLVQTLGIRGIPTPYRAPNAAAHIERLMGTLRREVLDRILVWNQVQLRAVLEEYIHGWYNNSRVHQGIHGVHDPDPELAAPKPANGRLVARPILNWLHHDYRLAA